VEYQETGVLFYVYVPPEDLRELSYRLVIDGLWSADPLNPRRETSPAGRSQSVVPLPPPRRKAPGAPPGIFSVSYQAPPGERITLAGSFNGWDPFMYELRETGPGFYALSLPLPPGAYQYVFIHRGERIPDPANQNRAYTREGKIVSEVIIR
jgi:hypothetical protein